MATVVVVVNMASRKSVSDDDLRKKLKEYNIVAPVTASTRSILIKKLNHAIANQKKATSANSRVKKAATNASRLNTFSSDDEDEDNGSYSAVSVANSRSSGSSSGRVSKSRRVSRGSGNTSVNSVNNRNDLGPSDSDSRGRQGGNHIPVSRSGNSDFTPDRFCRDLRSDAMSGFVSHDSGDYASSQIRKRSFFPVTSRPGHGFRTRVSDDYDTGSDSDVADSSADVINLSRKSYYALNNNNRENNLGHAGLSTSNNSYKAHQNHTSSNFSSSSGSFINATGGVGGRNRKAKSLENGDYDRGSSVDSDTSLLGLTESVVSQASANHDQVPRVANGRHHSTEPSPAPGGTLDRSQSEDESTWHYSVPLLLLVLLVAFFGVVGVLYVNMRVPLLPTLRAVPSLVHRAVANLPAVPFLSPLPHQSERQTKTPPVKREPATNSSSPTPAPSPRPASSRGPENKFPICREPLQSDCLSVQEMRCVQPLLGRIEDILMPALHNQAHRHQCGDSDLSYLPVDQAQKLFHEQYSSLKVEDVSEGISALGKLVDWNRHWGLSAVREKDRTLLGLSLASHPTYVLCHITTAIYSFFYLVAGVITVIVTAWLAFSCVRFHKQKAEEEKQQVYELIEQILEILGGMGSSSGKDVVAVNHVRDSLISPRDRRAKKKLWDKAVNFIDQYESRIRRDIQAVGGEDCEVWRWASGVPPHSASSSGPHAAADGSAVGLHPPAKVWQGPAFDSLSPHNVPNVSPTSCLKIRNMFDYDVEFGDNWPLRIQDSILEKCEGLSIVHIAVDRGSREGCVYLKCGSLLEAGQAFRSLHGWYYDGMLVTVKFLRDERYHQRFPAARNATRPLIPSNNKRLSMQTPPGQPLQPQQHTAAARLG